MTESQFTTKLLRALRQAMPEAMVWKHSDRFTAGIPDFSITRRGSMLWHTSWYEVKVLNAQRGANQYTSLFVPLQQETLKRIGGWMIIWSVPQKSGRLFRPDEGHWLDVEPLEFMQLVREISLIF